MTFLTGPRTADRVSSQPALISILHFDCVLPLASKAAIHVWRDALSEHRMNTI